MDLNNWCKEHFQNKLTVTTYRLIVQRLMKLQLVRTEMKLLKVRELRLAWAKIMHWSTEYGGNNRCKIICTIPINWLYLFCFSSVFVCKGAGNFSGGGLRGHLLPLEQKTAPLCEALNNFWMHFQSNAPLCPGRGVRGFTLTSALEERLVSIYWIQLTRVRGVLLSDGVPSVALRLFVVPNLLSRWRATFFADEGLSI